MSESLSSFVAAQLAVVEKLRRFGMSDEQVKLYLGRGHACQRPGDIVADTPEPPQSQLPVARAITRKVRR